MAHHVDWNAGLGSPVLISGIWYYAEDQERWWRDRGAGTIIFLVGDDPDGDGETPGPPDLDGPTEPERPATRGFSVYVKIAKPQVGSGIPALSAIASPPQNMTLDQAAAYKTIVGGTGSLIQIVFERLWHDRHVEDWVLLPYIHDVGRSARQAFLAEVAQELDWTLPVSASELLAAIKDIKKRRILRRKYQTYFGVEHNDVSMSLYSGPWPSPRGRETAHFSNLGYGRVGWMKTGDAPSKKDRYRDPFLRFFLPVTSQVGVLNLPHHGSLNNFHEELLEKMHPKISLITTEPNFNRVLDVNSTRMRVQSRNSEVRVVGADPSSICDISIWW